MSYYIKWVTTSWTYGTWARKITWNQQKKKFHTKTFGEILRIVDLSTKKDCGGCFFFLLTVHVLVEAAEYGGLPDGSGLQASGERGALPGVSRDG